MAKAKVLLGHGTQLSYSSGNNFVKSNVFNCLLKEKREVAVVTMVGRLFHARAARGTFVLSEDDETWLE